MAAEITSSLTCPRCGSDLGYAGRPCAICISPAIFSLKESGRHDLSGIARGMGPRSARRKTFRAPLSKRAIAALHSFSIWTLHSLLFAALAHAVLLAILMLFAPAQLFEPPAVTKISAEFSSLAPPAPITAPEKAEQLTPAPDDETTITPEHIFTERPAGSEDFEDPQEEKILAPEPALTEPAPSRTSEIPRLHRTSPEGLGGGQPRRTPSSDPGGSGLFRNRQGESRATAIRQHGGDKDSENAVNLGLQWLSEMQSADGSWDPTGSNNSRFDSGLRENWGGEMRTPLTALCVLPFLAAGHTPKNGEFAKTVDAAIKWLLRAQQSSGCFCSPHSSQQMYAHTVATLAMCEAYGLTGGGELKRSAERGVRFLERTQSSKGGWTYRAETTSTVRVMRNDLSISGWAVLALKSARAAGIGVNASTWKNLTELFDTMSLDTGETYYADVYPYEYRTGQGMAGVGLMARSILDAERFTAKNAAAKKYLARFLPDWDEFKKVSLNSATPNFATFYGVYNGTLGMFLATDGRGPEWDAWNAALKSALLEHQVLDIERHRGSWDPVDSWIGPVAGRLYSTACSVLCLEIYYRYANSRLNDATLLKGRETAPPADSGEKPGEVIKPKDKENDPNDMTKPANRSRALRELAKAKGLGAVPALIDALSDSSQSVRFTALTLCGDLRAKDAMQPVMEMLQKSENKDLRSTVAWALGKIGDKRAASTLINMLRDEETTVADAAHTALVALSGGKDYGVNQPAWRAHFGG